MKFIFASLIFLLTTPSFASQNTYKLDMQLSIDGQIVSSPKLVTVEGEVASITTNDNKKQSNYIEVIASEGDVLGKKGILMKFKIELTRPDGSRKILANPLILAKSGEESSIIINQENTGELSLKVTALRCPAPEGAGQRCTTL